MTMPIWYRDGCEIDLDDALGLTGDDGYSRHLHDHEIRVTPMTGFISPGYVYRYCRSCGCHLACDVREESTGQCDRCRIEGRPMPPIDETVILADAYLGDEDD